MRFKGRMELEHGLKAIDIAPIINVMFLLLMFFMLNFRRCHYSGKILVFTENYN